MAVLKIRLKELREKKGISQYKLASDLGVSQSTVGMWESGKNRPQQRWPRWRIILKSPSIICWDDNRLPRWTDSWRGWILPCTAKSMTCPTKKSRIFSIISVLKKHSASRDLFDGAPQGTLLRGVPLFAAVPAEHAQGIQQVAFHLLQQRHAPPVIRIPCHPVLKGRPFPTLLYGIQAMLVLAHQFLQRPVHFCSPFSPSAPPHIPPSLSGPLTAELFDIPFPGAPIPRPQAVAGTVVPPRTAIQRTVVSQHFLGFPFHQRPSNHFI